MQIRLKGKNIYANHQNKYERCKKALFVHGLKQWIFGLSYLRLYFNEIYN